MGNQSNHLTSPRSGWRYIGSWPAFCTRVFCLLGGFVRSFCSTILSFWNFPAFHSFPTQAVGFHFPSFCFRPVISTFSTLHYFSWREWSYQSQKRRTLFQKLNTQRNKFFDWKSTCYRVQMRRHNITGLMPVIQKCRPPVNGRFIRVVASPPGRSPSRGPPSSPRWLTPAPSAPPTRRSGGQGCVNDLHNHCIHLPLSQTVTPEIFKKMVQFTPGFLWWPRAGEGASWEPAIKSIVSIHLCKIDGKSAGQFNSRAIL